MLNFSKLQIFISALIASIILIISAFYYNQVETSSIQKEKYEYLNAVANLKIDQISKWKNERLSEAEFFPGVGRLIKSTVFLQKDKGDKEARNYLVETLLPIKERHRYKNILITDLNGGVLFSLDSSRIYVDSATITNGKVAVEKDSIFLSDFYYCSSHSEVHLDIYSPIKDNDKKAIAVFVLQIDPSEYLFPMIQKWPTPSKSAETLIYRKEGNAVRLLTSGKSLQNDSLNVIIPFERSDYVGVKGIFNQGEVIEGIDYKNSEVLAAISLIEGTDWYLISKVDKDEIYEDLLFKGWAITVLLFVSLLLIFVTAMYLYRLRQSEIYKSLFYKERELYETQERYKTTLYSIGDAVITTDAGGFIKNMNSVAEQLTGWKENESYGKKLKEVFRVINEDTNLEVEDPVAKVLQTNSVVGLANHTMLINKNGTSIPISDSGSPIKDDKGNIIGVVLVFRDQTEERAKEKAILESNNKFSKIFNSSSESISLTQISSGKLKEVNEGFIEMFGYSRSEVINKSTLDLELWANPSDRERMIEEIKSTGRIKNFEATGRRKNGEYIIALISGEIIIIDNEQMLLLTIRDITDRKKFEAVLKNEKERISAILNLVGDPIFVKDDQHRFTLANKAFFEMVGLDESKVIGKTLAENISQGEMEHFLKVDRLVLDSGITDTREEELTINNQTKTIVTSKTRFTDESGNRFLIGSIHDITDRVNADKEKAHFNDLMKYVISNTKSSVSVFDTEMNYIYVSDRYFSDFHLADKNIIGRNHYDVFPDLPQFLRDIHKRTLNGETLSGEADPLFHPDGSIDWANWTSMPWYNNDRTIGGIIVYLEVLTERKKAEEQIKLLAQMVAIAPGAILVHNFEGQIHYANQRAAEMYGCTNEEYMTLTLRDIDSIENAELFHIRMEDLINNGEINFEGKHRRKDGSTYPVQVFAKKIEWADKPAILSITTDITDRKIFEEKQKSSEEKLKMLLDFAPDAFFHGDAKGNFITVNNHACVLTGYTREELLSKNMKDLFPEEILESNPLQYDALKAGQTRKTERLILRKDGKKIFVEMISKQMPDGTYQSFFRDLTEQKKAQKEFEEAEERFRKAFITSPDSININRLSDGKYVSINAGFTRMTGYEEQEVIGKTSAEIQIWADEKYRNELVALLSKNSLVDNLEAKFRIKDGTLKDGLMSAAVIELKGEPHIISITRDISDRKKAEEEVLKTKTHYQKLIENAPDGIVQIGSDGLFKYISPSAKKIFGHPLDQRVNELPENLTHPDDVGFVQAAIADLIQNPEQIKTIEYRFRHTNGNYLWIESTFTNLLNDPTVNAIVINFRDISFRKKAEQELLKKFLLEEQISKIAKTAPGGLCTFKLSPDGKTSMPYVSETWTSICGIKHDEVKEDTNIIYSRVHKDDLEKFALSIKESAEKMTDWFYEYRLFHPEKGYIWLEGHSTPTREKDGSIMWYGFISDIDDRKKLMNEIMESEEKFRSIWESSIDAMRLIGEKGTIINVNQSYCNLFGLKKEDLIGKLFNVSYIITDKDKSLAGYEDRFKRRTIQKKFETEIQLVNGEIIWVELTNSFIEHKDKEPMLLSIIRDITDRKKLITQLTESKTKAEEMVKLKSYFFANMSHELRTPFVGILGFAEILKDTLQNPNEREYAEQILKSSKRLTDTLNKILNVTRLEFDKVDIKLTEFDVVKMLKNVESLYSNSAKINKTILSTVTDEKSIKIRSDAKLLEDILNNLVNNAVKFTHNGSIKLSASIIAEEENRCIEIKVEDTGIGIPAEKQILVWQEFRQASEGLNRSFEGTGLGLTISKKYVELLGGRISLQSEERKGSVFTITLPVHPNLVSTVTNKTTPKSEIKPLHKIQPSGKPKILYVEDDIVALQFINIVLKSGYDIDTAFSAKEALEKVVIKKYDTLMLDINLGSGMDGLELMQKIRENDYYKNIPVVAVTAYAAESDKTEFLTKGFNYYISKPFTQKELFKLLSEIFSSK